MLLIHVRNEHQDERFQHALGAFEIGRGPRRELPRYCVDDLTVSKDQLRVEVLPDGSLRLENLSKKSPIVLGGRTSIPPGGIANSRLPARMRAGNSHIILEEEETLDPAWEALQTIDRPQSLRGTSPIRSLKALGDSPAPDTLVRWFETVVSVQRSAASTEEFYDATARAVVELVGLDSGLVLLRQTGGWEIAARYPQPQFVGGRLDRSSQKPSLPGSTAKESSSVQQGTWARRSQRDYSETILDRVVLERRTFYDALLNVPLTASLSQVEAVVASPIFDRQGEVCGAVYGTRFRGTGALAAIKPLEAEVVQVLAAAVGAGRARLESEREAIRQQVELEKMQVKFEVVREIQAGFFPRTMPDAPGYEFCGHTQSADAAGGDYYDVISLEGGRIGLVIADVSGHGLGESLLMASMRAALRGLIHRDPEPVRLVEALNDAMYDDLRAQEVRFITMLYGLLDPATHEFCYANAAHGPLVLHLPAGQTQFSSLPNNDDQRGFPLGVMKEPYPACVPVSLQPGDLIVLGSDGVVETRRDQESFGLERVQQLLLSRRDAPLTELRDAILTATNEFRGGTVAEDDLTLLLLRRK